MARYRRVHRHGVDAPGRRGQGPTGTPVRRYIPELTLKDQSAAAEITVLNLLNHTTGMDWGLVIDTGEGDDALARYVEGLPELDLIAPPDPHLLQPGRLQPGRADPGEGHGQTFDRAVASLVFEPLGLSHSFYLHEEVMTRRFAVGHNPTPEGTLAIARLRRRPRGDNPGGGLASSISDLLRWARSISATGEREWRAGAAC